jgi:hypothetical protein
MCASISIVNPINIHTVRKEDYMENKKRKPGVTFTLDDEALYDALNSYRISMGISWPRFFLTGVAEKIATNGDNPDLAIKLVDYLSTRR